MELKGRRALVTGGTRGIGKAVALEFARQGADVVICGTNKEKLESVKTELQTLGVRSEGYVCDVGDPVQVEKTVRLAADFPGYRPRKKVDSRSRFMNLRLSSGIGSLT